MVEFSDAAANPEAVMVELVYTFATILAVLSPKWEPFDPADIATSIFLKYNFFDILKRGL